MVEAMNLHEDSLTIEVTRGPYRGKLLAPRALHRQPADKRHGTARRCASWMDEERC